MDREHGKEGESLPPMEAEAAALDFCARAANVDLWIHANLGDTREDVELDCRAVYDAFMAVARADRHLAVTLLRFAWGRASWGDVKVAQKQVIHREIERMRLADGVLEMYEMRGDKLQ